MPVIRKICFKNYKRIPLFVSENLAIYQKKFVGRKLYPVSFRGLNEKVVDLGTYIDKNFKMAFIWRLTDYSEDIIDENEIKIRALFEMYEYSYWCGQDFYDSIAEISLFTDDSINVFAENERFEDECKKIEKYKLRT